MKKITKLFLLALVIVFLAGSSAVFAQEINLEYKSPAKRVEYVLSSDAKSIFSLYGLEKLIVQSSMTDFTYEKGNKTEDGVAVKLKVVDQKLVTDGVPVTETEKGEEIEMVLTPKGKIVQSTNINILENFQDLIISFPAEKVKKGSKWSNSIPMQLPDGKGGVIDADAKINCEITDIKKFKGVKCAFINTKLVITPPKTKKNNMKAEATGKIYFDYKNGIILGMRNELKLKLDVYKFIKDKKILFTSLSLKMINKLRMK